MSTATAAILSAALSAAAALFGLDQYLLSLYDARRTAQAQQKEIDDFDVALQGDLDRAAGLFEYSLRRAEATGALPADPVLPAVGGGAGVSQ